MVVFQIKNSDNDSFLYEASSSAASDDVVRELTEIWNLRLRLAQLTGGIREMGRYGPMKHPDKAGLDEIATSYGGQIVERNEHYEADPTGLRSGNGVGPQLLNTIERVAQDAESVLSKVGINYDTIMLSVLYVGLQDLVARKIPVSVEMLQEKLDNIKGAVMMCYPMGLPEWDTVRLTIEGIEGLEGTAAGQALMNPDSAELWIASRCLDRSPGQTVADRLGRNEKTKVIAKMQKPGAGAPGREPGVSEDEKKAMMAYYFKKQEELKKLSENDEDDYLHSSWADPKQLQRSLRGQTDSIRAPGLR